MGLWVDGADLVGIHFSIWSLVGNIADLVIQVEGSLIPLVHVIVQVPLALSHEWSAHLDAWRQRDCPIQQSLILLLLSVGQAIDYLC